MRVFLDRAARVALSGFNRQMKIAVAGLAVAVLASGGFAAARAAEPANAAPIKIGLGMSLSGPLAANGKSALLAMQIWVADVNAKGGLLGRPVKLVYYDNQSNPSTVPGIYTKLLDVDHVNLVISGYATNMIAPAMPIVMEHGKVFESLFGLAVNKQFHYAKYFSMLPTGPNAEEAFTKGFFDTAMAQNPKPKTVAIVGANADFSNHCMTGARANAKAADLKVVYDQTYPPRTTNYDPVVQAIQAVHPDLAVICSYPLDSVGMVHAINELGFKPEMIGGGMVGLQSTSVQTELGSELNGIVVYNFWLPEKTMEFPGVQKLIKDYQAKAASEGVDPLGYYMAPWGYADLQVLGQAVEATKSLDDSKLAGYMHKATFHTVVGDIKFGADGEWSTSRVLQVQFHGISGHGLDQFRNANSVETILTPSQYKTGSVIYPYSAAAKAKTTSPAG
ncbi:MAG TPA: amino acid ABC transporter substrate-binding protein [Xanthobacteraceae bacterium]|nr:amino acid ABC transporter substrate-binding protein [Xanthobacteraceae bacterium]